MLRCIIVLYNNCFCIGTSVSISAFMAHAANGFAVVHVPLFLIIRRIFGYSSLAGLIMLFKPLLSGIGRALVLLVKPRLSKEEQQARRQMRDAETMRAVINSSNGPSHAAELRAMASRN